MALTEQKPRNICQQHKEREAARGRLTLRFDGPLDDVAIIQALADRKGRNQVKQNRRTRTEEEIEVSSRLRHMLDEPDTRRAPVRVGRLVPPLNMKITHPKKQSRKSSCITWQSSSICHCGGAMLLGAVETPTTTTAATLATS